MDRQPVVIVIEYDINPESSMLFDEAIEQVRQRMKHPDQPHTKVVQVYAAIDDDARRILKVFDKEGEAKNECR